MRYIADNRLVYIVISMVFVFISACSYTSDSKDAVWLHGVWELTHNPDKDDADNLDFKDDGTVIVRTQDGREIHGKYLIDENHLKMTLVIPKNIIDVEFTISEDKTKLIYENGAFYTKQ